MALHKHIAAAKKASFSHSSGLGTVKLEGAFLWLAALVVLKVVLL